MSENADETQPDPQNQIGRLDAANNPPIYVAPDASLEQVLTPIMLNNDFSQVPLISGTRDLRGIVTWKTIGRRLARSREPIKTAMECKETAEFVAYNYPLLDAISKIVAHDYVLIQAQDKTFCGIVTASDLAKELGLLAGPFLLIGEIERGLRSYLTGKFTLDELVAVKAPGDDKRAIQSISNLTFGEYVRLIENKENWIKLGLQLDRVSVVQKFREILDIRNRVMHFDPKSLKDADLNALRATAQLLKDLR